MTEVVTGLETLPKAGNYLRNTERVALAAAVLVSSLAVLSKPARAIIESRQCTNYNYAGIIGHSAATGVSARITETKTPQVYDGHVAGWAGMVGFANGQYDQTSLQAGLERSQQQSNSWVYVELIKNGKEVFLRNILPVRVGQQVELQIKEIAKDWWEVDVNGRKRTPVFNLPNTHGRLKPFLLGENYPGGSNACNDYSYSFKNVSTPVEPANFSKMQDSGYRYKQLAGRGNFIATSPSN